MSAAALSWAWQVALPADQKLALLALAWQCAEPDGNHCPLDLALTAQLCGIAEPAAVPAQLDRLADSGLLRLVPPDAIASSNAHDNATVSESAHGDAVSDDAQTHVAVRIVTPSVEGVICLLAFQATLTGILKPSGNARSLRSPFLRAPRATKYSVHTTGTESRDSLGQTPLTDSVPIQDQTVCTDSELRQRATRCTDSVLSQDQTVCSDSDLSQERNLQNQELSESREQESWSGERGGWGGKPISDAAPQQNARQQQNRNPVGHRLPPDWTPGSDGWAFAEHLSLDPQAVFDSFRDYWLAKAGAAARKVDWLATWRNWCRKEAERSNPLLPARLPPIAEDWDDPILGDDPLRFVPYNQRPDALKPAWARRKR